MLPQRGPYATEQKLVAGAGVAPAAFGHWIMRPARALTLIHPRTKVFIQSFEMVAGGGFEPPSNGL